MTEDLEVDEWKMYDALAKINEGDSLTVVRSKKTLLPKDALRWQEVVGEFSLYNEYPAIMSYFVSLGQMLKDKVRVPIGRLSLDPRIHFCWVQTARSGKTTMFDFLSPVWKETFMLINKHPTTTENPQTPLSGVNEFTLNNPDSFTDQALLGTMKMNAPNPDYDRNEARRCQREDEDYDISEFIDMTIFGSLYGSGIIAFDEFEHSGIFKETQHKQETVMLFQKFMNRLDSDSHLIRKRLTEWGKDLVVDSQRSLWATTLPPEGLEKVILTKGVFQRMWLYVRDVPESLKQRMEEDYIDMIGEIDEGVDGAAPYQEEFAEMLYSTYKWVEQRLEEENGDARKVVLFSKDAQKKLKTVWKGMRKYMNNFDDNIYDALNTFLMNMINNICIAASLCAISERSKVVTAAHINQGRQLTDESFDSITSWFTDKLKKRPKRLADKSKEKGFVNAYNATNPKIKFNGTDGWVNKANLIQSYAKIETCARNTFYRNWPAVQHLFEEVRTTKTYVRLKVNEDE